MAVVWPTPQLPNGHLVNDEDWNTHADNLDDLNTRLDAVEVEDLPNRVSDLETIQAGYGRWYSTSTANHTASTPKITGWTNLIPLPELSVVSDGTWTCNTSGYYMLNAGWHGTHDEALDTGANTNVFIARTDLSEIFAQAQSYRVQYNTGPLEASETISTGVVQLTAGDTFAVYLGTAFVGGVTLSGGDGLRRTFFTARRVG